MADRPLKLLALTHTYPRFAGDTNGPFVEFLMNELAARGHEVTVLTAWDRELNTRCEPEPGKVRLLAYRYAPCDAAHILGYSRTIKADVKVKGAMLALAPLMIEIGTRRLLRLAREIKPDVIQAHWFLPNGYMAVRVGRALGIPVVATLHGSDVFVAEKGFPYSYMTRVTNRGISRLTSCSPELRDRICRLGFPTEYSHVIPYAADPEMLQRGPDPEAAQQARIRLGLQDCYPLVFALGRLVYKKGFEYLIRAMPALIEKQPGAHLVIGGEGDLHAELTALCRSLGIEEQVHFVGRLLRDQIPPLMAASDIFVMPSIKDRVGNIDGLPNVILEAMALHKPVIASNVAGIPLAVGDGKNGRLVAQKDPQALAEALIDAAADRDRLHNWGLESRRRIEEELNWGVIADRYEQVFRDTITQFHGGSDA